MTARTEKLKESLLNSPFEICPERAVIWTEAMRQTEGRPQVIRNALALKMLLENMTVRIYEGELIVGNRSSKRKGSPLFPEIKSFALETQLDTYDSRPVQPFQVSMADKAAIKKALPFWRGKTVWERAFALMPRELQKDVFKLVFTVEAEFQNGIGHFIVGNHNLLQKGFKGIKAEAENKLTQVGKEEGEKRKEFLQAVIIVCEAAVNFARRFALEALRLEGRESDPARKQELLRIAQVCAQVPENPPRDFYEAVSAVWFNQLICQLECGGFAISPGRLDQALYPFYRQDLEQGRTTPASAQELIECLYIKMSEVVNVLDTIVLSVTSGPPIAQSLTIGGTDASGSDATSELSRIFLAAHDAIRTVSPNLAVRFHPQTPPDFSNAVYDAVRRGAMMSLFNDSVIVPGLVSCGVPEPEARDYALVGCVEPTTNGSAFGSTDSNLVNIARCLEFALANGDGMDLVAHRNFVNRKFGPYLLPRRNGKPRGPHYLMLLKYFRASAKALQLGAMDFYGIMRGKQSGPATGDPRGFHSIDDLIRAWQSQVSYFVKRMAEAMNFCDQAHAELKPTPFISSTIDDCLGRGKDVTSGGARYNFTGPQAVGLADVADSLAALKTLVFDRKKVTMSELLKGMQNNFKDAEPLRQMLLNRVPKYGNDDELADGFARRAAEIYCQEVARHQNFRGGAFRPGIYSMSSHLVFGILTGALPDGRLRGDSLGAGVSPGRGRELKGPTAVFRSVAKIDGVRITNGCALNMAFNPDLLSGDENLRKFAELNRAYFRLGGFHVQYNILSAETLREAQQFPERHRGLVVRVAGYSGLFTVLDRATQDDLIARTRHGCEPAPITYNSSSDPKVCKMDYIKFEEARPEAAREMLKKSPVAYVPMGALEWHGEHNPLGLDGLKAYALCEMAAAKTGGVLFPAMFWGASDTMPFPFTFHFPRGVYRTLVRQTLTQLKEMGFSMIVLLTGHYPPWLVSLLKKECRRFNRAGGAFALGAPEQMFALELQYYGDHAGMWETSIMRALRPELVRLEAMPEGLSTLERLRRFGVMGQDPRKKASAEKGRQAVELIAANLAEAVRKTLENKNGEAIEEIYQRHERALRWYVPGIIYVIREALDVHSLRELIRYGWWNLKK